MKKRFWIVLIAHLLIVVTSPGAAGTCWSQEEVTRQQFDQSMLAWKDKLKKILVVHRDFLTCEEDDALRLREEWLQLKAEGDALAGKVIDQAAELYQKSNIQDLELKQLLDPLVEGYYESGRYEKSARIGTALLTHDPANRELMFATLKSAFAGNNFDIAGKIVEQWKQQLGELPPVMQSLAEFVPYFQTEWKRELEFRAKEAQRDDLPRIQFETSKGNFVVELFEESAPNAVNLFVFLVENEFFVNMTFFQVWNHEWVWSGCPNNQGIGAPRHGVPSEVKLPDARKHFRGSFSLRISDKDNTARSQFFITKTPFPDFDGVNLVIGRVIEGMDVVDSLTATHERDPKNNPKAIEGATPDPLISVKVLRKRDHEYEPEIAK